MGKFVECAHDGVEGTARLSRAGLKHMPGWAPVDGSDAVFVPGDHGVAAVNAHLDAHPDQAGVVLAAERADKGRVGVLEGPHKPDTPVLDPDGDPVTP